MIQQGLCHKCFEFRSSIKMEDFVKQDIYIIKFKNNSRYKNAHYAKEDPNYWIYLNDTYPNVYWMY
jgi:hypothetical protein